MSVVAGEAEAGIGPTEPAHPPRDRLDLSAPGIEKALQELVRVRLLSVSGSFFCTHPSWSQLVQRLQRSDSMPDPALAPLHALVRQQMPLAEVHFTQYYFALVAEGSGRSLDLYRIGGVRARAMRMLCYNSDNIMRAMEWARRSPTPAQLLVPFLLHGRAVLRFCVPARFRRDCYAAALEMIGYHQCKADLVPSDDDAADDASEATRLHQCMFVRYMPATRDESLLLCGLGEAYLDGLHIREAAIPLQESLRFFFSECSNALQVPEQRYQAIDEACLDEEIQRLQSGASGSPSSCDSDSSDAADRAKDISMAVSERGGEVAADVVAADPERRQRVAGLSGRQRGARAGVHRPGARHGVPDVDEHAAADRAAGPDAQHPLCHCHNAPGRSAAEHGQTGASAGYLHPRARRAAPLRFRRHAHLRRRAGHARRRQPAERRFQDGAHQLFRGIGDAGVVVSGVFAGRTPSQRAGAPLPRAGVVALHRAGAYIPCARVPRPREYGVRARYGNVANVPRR
eukprot:ctg_2947.g597